MASKRPAIRTFTIPISPSSNATINITEPDIKADNLPLETWASSAILASQLHKIQIDFPLPPPSTNNGTPSHTTIPVLELGAGTGLVSLAASLIWNQPVLLTDLPPILPGLEANIAVNTATLAARTVATGVLDWTIPVTLTIAAVHSESSSLLVPGSYTAPTTSAHVLLAADTLYSEEHPALLSMTVATWLARDPAARLVLGTALRVAYLEEIRELWAMLEGVGLECVEEGKGMAEEKDFDDERLVEWSVWRWGPEGLR